VSGAFVRMIVDALLDDKVVSGIWDYFQAKVKFHRLTTTNGVVREGEELIEVDTACS
jgi:hypothetical protein